MQDVLVNLVDLNQIPQNIFLKIKIAKCIFPNAQLGASEPPQLPKPANCPGFLKLSCLFDTPVFPVRKVFSVGIKVDNSSFWGFLSVRGKCHNITSLAREMAFHL